MYRSGVVTVRKEHTEDLPAGEYEGVWNKNRVTVTIDGQVYELQTQKGVNLTNTVCSVTVNVVGEITVREAGQFDID